MLFASVQPSSSWFCADLSVILRKTSDLVPAENFVSLCQKMINLENLVEINQINLLAVTYLFICTAFQYPSLKD